MKKLSLLIVLALLVTVGGVYATWTYAGAAVPASHKHMSVNIASLGAETAKGTIVNVTNSMDVLLDDVGNYKAGATFSGKMGFVFIPAPGADADVVVSGIELQYTVEQATPLKYDGNNIFTIDQDATEALGKGEEITDTNKATLVAGVDLSQYVDGFYVEILGRDVANFVQLADIVLDTRAEYEAMEAALIAGGAIGITVSEVVATP